MSNCKFCGSFNVKWKDVSAKGESPKWELWNCEEGFPPSYKHDCGFRSISSCKKCGELIRWKECFDTMKGTHYMAYHHHKNERHACKWKHIKHLDPKDRYS